MIKPRLFLYPFSILYDGVTRIRNFFYDKGLFKSHHYTIPVICIGNLSVGGTGKTPMTEYLLSILKTDFKVGVVSRGYGRKSKGFLEVYQHSLAKDVGDEPLQIKQNHPEALVFVAEKRHLGISKIKDRVDVVILDDAFQHRSVTPSFTILLTAYDALYNKDYVLPAGNLREARNGFKRADVVVVTKCPTPTSYAKMQEITFSLQLEPYQKLYFATIGYSKTIVNLRESLAITYLKDKPFTLITGIANPDPLVAYLQGLNLKFEHIAYPDHHLFSDQEIASIAQKELVLTTQKDYVRLQPKMDKYALYYLPIVTEIIAQKASFFEDRIRKEATKQV